MRKRPKNTKKKETVPVQNQEEPTTDVDYDGYYDDVQPPDIGRTKEGMDKALIKKVALVGVVVFLIISLCVALLYVL